MYSDLETAKLAGQTKNLKCSLKYPLQYCRENSVFMPRCLYYVLLGHDKELKDVWGDRRLV